MPLVSKAWIFSPIFRVSKQDLCFTFIEEDGGDKRLVRLACKADSIAPADLSYTDTASNIPLPVFSSASYTLFQVHCAS